MTRIFFVFSIDYQLMTHRRPIVEAALSEGYEVTIVAQDTGYSDICSQMGCRFINLPVNRVGKNPIEELRTLYFLYKLYKKEKPDIVHHVSFKISLWGGLAAKMANIKCVVNAINGLGIFFQSGKIDSLVKRVFMRIMHFSNSRQRVCTIFQNDDDAKLFLDNGALKPQQYVKIDGSGVNLNEYYFSPLPTGTPKKILFSSRMLINKGVLDIIEAARMLKPKYEGKIQFVLCGLIEENSNGVSEKYLREVCDGKYIVYLGLRHDICHQLQEASIALLPSYYREGIPKALIEAASVGRPIITTNSVGCKETVKDGYNGFLVPIKSPKDIAEKIDYCLMNEPMMVKMGINSRELAERRFSVDKVIKSHFALYRSMLN